MSNKPKPRCVYIGDEDWNWLKSEAEALDRNRPAFLRSIIQEKRKERSKKK